jgi:ribosomal-protein-alanine N-acetyltransferase
MSNYLIQTPRLGLRTWQETDLEPFANINANPKAMQFYPNTLDKTASNKMVLRIQKQYKEHGFSVYAVDLLESKQFIGYIGFMRPSFESYFTPCVEIGWRLDPSFWNKGLATEGALACLDYGFNTLNFKEVYSFTAEINKPSERVMQKIGLEKIDAFEHPLLEKNSPLAMHVLYRRINKSTEE